MGDLPTSIVKLAGLGLIGMQRPEAFRLIEAGRFELREWS
jgi:hypothetical protein